jgi:alpha-pyrone synthase
MKAYISAIGTANPKHKIAQADIALFMARAMQLNETEMRKQMVLYKYSGIQYRYSVLEDYAKSGGDYMFYPNTEDMEPFPSVTKRMEVYRNEALGISVQAARQCFEQVEIAKEQITHLVTVSCTGMYAPGLDIELIEALRLPTYVHRTQINFMGCYAAFNGIKAADALCKANPEAKVLVVCTELCSIHFQKGKDEDNLLANALFGDGSAAILVQGTKPQRLGLALEHFYCDLALAGKQDMAWHIGDYGFEMKLSSYVPDFIKGGIGQLTNNLLQSLDLNLSDIPYLAIHPGGRRILEAIESALGMEKEKNKFAYEVLQNYGNMSSPTVIFVLREIWKTLTYKDHGKPILSFAFGPGLTMESMLLRITQGGER